MVAAFVADLAPVPIPRVRLFTDKILVSSELGGPRGEEELTLPVLCLSFDYGGTVIGATEERERFFVSHGPGVISVERDFEREAEARSELERFGAVELGCLEGYEESFGSPANYVVAADDTVFAFSEVKLGIVPAVISPFVLRRIGLSHARALFVTGVRIGGRWLDSRGPEMLAELGVNR